MPTMVPVTFGVVVTGTQGCNQDVEQQAHDALHPEVLLYCKRLQQCTSRGESFGRESIQQALLAV